MVLLLREKPMLHSALFACAASVFASAAPAHADTASPARCQDMNFRIYFQRGSATLDRDALQTIRFAQSRLSACNYAEMHVRLDANEPAARQRGLAILAAANGRHW